MGYEAAAAAARKLLAKKGVSVVLTRKGQGTADPIAGTRTSGGDKTSAFNCVGLPPGRSAEKEIGTLVNRRIIEFHLARTSGDLEPQPGDLIPWKGADWPLIWSAVYDPDATGMIYAKAYAEIGG